MCDWIIKDIPIPSRKEVYLEEKEGGEEKEGEEKKRGEKEEVLSWVGFFESLISGNKNKKLIRKVFLFHFPSLHYPINQFLSHFLYFEHIQKYSFFIISI